MSVAHDKIGAHLSATLSTGILASALRAAIAKGDEDTAAWLRDGLRDAMARVESSACTCEDL